jgi:hypothetical protein
MRITMLATAGAVVFGVAVGSAAAADQFATLRGVPAKLMSSGELSAVKGTDHHFFIVTSADNPNAVLVMLNGVNTYVLEPKASDSAAPQAGNGRFSTDHVNEEENAVDLFGTTVAPSYQGLAVHACTMGAVAVVTSFVTCR